jgi:hypothetical protein
MKIPGGDNPIIDDRKLRSYCLDQTHPNGAHKARLFESIVGITLANQALLLDALRVAAKTDQALEGKSDQYGDRFTVDFELVGPKGKALVRSGWIIHHGEDRPRLITCYIL